MENPKRFNFNTQFNFVNKVSVCEFFYTKMFTFISSILGFISYFIIYLVKFITRFLFRFHVTDDIQKEEQNFLAVLPQKINEPDSKFVQETEPEPEIVDFSDTDYDGFNEKESPEFVFKFQFQRYEDSIRNNGESEESLSLSENGFTTTTNNSKYQLMPGKGFSGFMEEPQVMNFSVQQFNFNENKDIVHGGSLIKKNVDQFSSIHGVVENLSEKEEVIGFDSKTESNIIDDKISYMNHTVESNCEEFLSERDFGVELEPMVEPGEDIENSEELIIDENSRTMEPRLNENFGSPKEEEEEMDLQNSSVLGTEFLSESEFGEKEALEKEDSPQVLENSQKPSSQNSSISGSEDSNRLETLWEHQELIEQLKMEIKKVRATGLPTILEECESPKMVEDLKPWKIDEQYLHDDRISQLHKFYKIYRERMRKLDILNYQKMYGIGFLQVKDPLQAISFRKSATPTLTSILAQNFRLSKRKTPETESTSKFISELQNDLEAVYVGQLCLSWEFLHWQYIKSQELFEADPYETRRYNEVAGEFQQFQVLIQRFLENEAFEGPRVQNYIKNRCILRNLLQVPVVREDSEVKDDQTRRRKDAITCTMLLKIIEESMQVLWQFIRADKNEGNMMLKGFLGHQVELQDPEDSKLLLEVQTTLQKKEKQVKEISRIGNCLMRKFQKNHEERSSQVLFYSQVDLKLVSRVLSMSKLTSDQLVWCLKKLNKIRLVDRKVHMDSSFSPFPC